jgi:hypothetical protein
MAKMDLHVRSAERHMEIAAATETQIRSAPNGFRTNPSGTIYSFSCRPKLRTETGSSGSLKAASANFFETSRLSAFDARGAPTHRIE